MNQSLPDSQIIRAREEHLDLILNLAESNTLQEQTAESAAAIGFLVSSFREDDYRRFLKQADHFYIAMLAEDIAGYVLAYSRERIDPSWFVDWHVRTRYEEPFVVIKQVCTHLRYRRIGMGTQLYDFVAQQAPGSSLVSAIVLEPYNEASVRFHENLGFRKTLELTPPDGLRRGVWRRAATA